MEKKAGLKELVTGIGVVIFLWGLLHLTKSEPPSGSGRTAWFFLKIYDIADNRGIAALLLLLGAIVIVIGLPPYPQKG